MLLGSILSSHTLKVQKLRRNSLIIFMKKQYVLKIWLKQLNLFLKITIITNSNVKHQTSRTAIETKFTSPYACIYMGYIQNQFLKNEQIQPWSWFRYINDIFFISTASEKEIDNFLERLNNFHPNLKFTHERSREEINFFDVTVRVNHGEFITGNLLMAISTFTLNHVTLVT